MDNSSLGYEPENLNTRPMLMVGLVLILTCVLSVVVGLCFFDALEAWKVRSDETVSGVNAVRVLPSSEVLQKNPAEDIAVLRSREAIYTERYGWAEGGKTHARIPVERAMEIMVESGRLPVRKNESGGAQ